MFYDYACEHCDGAVREKLVAREAFKHRLGFVPIGVCHGRIMGSIAGGELVTVNLPSRN